MQIILLVVGLVLLFVGGDWFDGADTVGVICLVVFGVLCALQAALVTMFSRN